MIMHVANWHFDQQEVSIAALIGISISFHIKKKQMHNIDCAYHLLTLHRN